MIPPTVLEELGFAPDREERVPSTCGGKVARLDQVIQPA